MYWCVVDCEEIKTRGMEGVTWVVVADTRIVLLLRVHIHYFSYEEKILRKCFSFCFERGSHYAAQSFLKVMVMFCLSLLSASMITWTIRPYPINIIFKVSYFDNSKEKMRKENSK